MTETAVSYAGTQRSTAGERPVSYHVAGEGAALLLIHGSGPGVSAWANFGELVPILSTRYRVVMPDLPGYGASYVPELDGDYGRTALDAVRQVLAAEGIDRVHVVGNSLGGMLALRLALEHPDLVDRIVAMGPGGASFPLFGPQPTEGIKRLVEFTNEPSRDKLVAWMHSMVGDAAFVTQERVDARWASASAPEALAFTREFYAAAMRSMQSAAAAAPLWTRLVAIAHPVLLVYGREDRVTPVESAFLPLRLMRNAELHVVGNAGHWVMLERPRSFVRIVLEFLGRPATGEAL
jgi:4,5:9,10-diseco-3-hydroxy-5,9,17-trioxoandrosta-1(10),2-diene-4-oate hydrolase